MSDPVLEAELKAVPLDKAREFVRIEDEAWQERGARNGSAIEHDLDYMSRVLAAAKECGIPSLAAWRLPGLYGDDTLSICTDFRVKARHIAHILEIRAGLPPKKKLPTSPGEDGGRDPRAREILQTVSRAKRAAEQELLIISVAGKPAYAVLSWEAYCRLCPDGPGVVELPAEPGSR